MLDFTTTYLTHHADIYRYVYLISADKTVVEDIVQDTFLLLHKKQTKLSNHPYIKGWLYTTARNIAWDYMKKQKRKAKYELELSSQALTEVYNIDIVPNDIYNALSAFLSDEEIEFLRLNSEYGLTVKEIAENKGFSYSALQSRIWRLKEKIKKVWGDLNG